VKRLLLLTCLALTALGVACDTTPGPTPTPTPEPTATPDPTPTPTPAPQLDVLIDVTLDGAPVGGVTVLQGGRDNRTVTDAAGRATVDVDRTLDAEHWVVASHPDARQMAAQVTAETADGDLLTIELTSFDASDNPDYVFRHPGTPDLRDSTAYCAHCHQTMAEDWFASPHRQAASNPVVHDLFSGVVTADEAACAEAGGTWGPGLEPGTRTAIDRCFLGDGVLPALNPGCADCDADATAFGGCADCHAPGIDGQLGGRSLLEATDRAYDFGVHCDVCHHVEGLDPDAEPGVAGALHIVRPSEGPMFGKPFQPLMFGPYDDAPTAFMGSVHREFFTESEFCAGCHEQRQAVLVPNESIDLARWPDGRLPIHTTFTEWQDSPIAGVLECQSCHMPADDPKVTNSADLQLLPGIDAGFTAGWVRPAGSVKQHGWYGPRQPESGILQTAASITITKVLGEGELTASVTVRNGGAGHAIPTGEPMRSMVLQVEASCAGTPINPTGGAVVPAFGGALATQVGGDWSQWPGAAVGERIRVVARDGFIDYSGFGPFGDGTFSTEAKGLPQDSFVGEVTITAVDGDTVTTDPPIPAGDVAYRVEAAPFPTADAPSASAAGAPGFAFARVLAGADGRTMVPHFLATDVVSDNRILPGAVWTSEHRFASPCAEPEVHAVLVHRAYPPALARERGWTLTESVAAEETE